MKPLLADAHLHLFSRGYLGSNGALTVSGEAEIDAYETYRARFAIRAGLVIGYEADGIDPGNNAYIRSLAASRPWMHTLAYVSTQNSDGAIVRDLLTAGHAGIVVYVPDAAHAEHVANWPTEIWDALDSAHALVSFNARPEATAILGPLLRRLGHNTRFLFSHLGLPGRYAAAPSKTEAAARIRRLLDISDMPNVFVKISGMYAASDPPTAWPHEAAGPFISVLLDRFGPKRCLWASDFSPALEFVSFADTIAVPWLHTLKPDGRENVMGGNLLRMLDRSATAA